MADEADIAQENLERSMAYSIAYRKTTPYLAPRGCCHNPLCDERFDEDSLKLFCNGNCAKDFERYK
jgi:hypothetical protein